MSHNNKLEIIFSSEKSNKNILKNFTKFTQLHYPIQTIKLKIIIDDSRMMKKRTYRICFHRKIVSILWQELHSVELVCRVKSAAQGDHKWFEINIENGL